MTDDRFHPDMHDDEGKFFVYDRDDAGFECAGPFDTFEEAEASAKAKARLEELRIEINEERISYGEIAELQGLVAHIGPGDVQLLEWAGVPEHEGGDV